MIWALILIIAVVVLTLLIEPYFRKTAEAENLDEKDYLVAQFDDIARDRAAGLLSDKEADETEKEARRRLLVASKTSEGSHERNNGFIGRNVSIVIISAAPLAAIILYALIGNPAQQTTQKAIELAQRTQLSEPGNGAQGAPSLIASVNALEQRLADAPEDLAGWAMLGESYTRMDRFAEAATAFARARELEPDSANLHAAEGEALAMANDGVVNKEALAALQQALQLDSAEPRARFYLALAAYQRDEREKALKEFVALANDSPANAGWMPLVRSQIDSIAAELGRPLDTLGIEDDYSENMRSQGMKNNFIGAGPTQDQIQAAERMSTEDRTVMVEGMIEGLVSRLREDPNDLEGWTMLARSYAVMDDLQKSADAYARAIELAPGDIDLRLGKAEVLLNILWEEGAPIDENAKTAIDEVSRLNPEHPFALYFQGLAASQRGDAARAKTYWERLLVAMPEDSQEAASIRDMIAALK
ncbi:c-type cytochrome biogenesis protein CcmI [Hyphococcus sp.]|uniref:c-type cytochrome biogenesis protein CcmI n=1 Tax=Hyphococcus sp. TaxID=2038636 RepID=UPI003CCBB804